MLLKFIQLQVGQAFVFEGEPYVKSSPLMGRHGVTGQERFLPRSALVTTGNDHVTAPPVPSPDIATAQVLEAWRAFQAHMGELAQSWDQRGETVFAGELRRKLEAAGKDFEERLQLPAAR